MHLVPVTIKVTKTPMPLPGVAGCAPLGATVTLEDPYGTYRRRAASFGEIVAGGGEATPPPPALPPDPPPSKPAPPPPEPEAGLTESSPKDFMARVRHKLRKAT